MNEALYQKTGLIVSRLALELLAMKIGDRIPSISNYEHKFEVARGTIQNAFAYLKQQNALKIQNKGKLGSYIIDINYHILQQYSFKDTLMGIMPLPYSKLYEGLATALYDSLKAESINFNMAYVRGAQARIQMVANGSYHFAVCSAFAARRAMEQKLPVNVVCNLGDYTYVSKHVLVMRQDAAGKIEDGMRIGIDMNSIDQRELTIQLVKNHPVTLIEMHSHQIVTNIKQGVIDAGVWNFDEIHERGESRLKVIDINDESAKGYTQACIVIHNDNQHVQKLLLDRLDTRQIKEIQKKVCDGTLIPSY